MPLLERPDGTRLNYAIDDHTDPWSSPEVVLMLHGIAETGLVFRAWAPHFSRRYRVVRPDLRGFGRSGALGHARLDGAKVWADDMEALVSVLGANRVHVVGAKLGALVALELALRGPAWMRTLTLAGALLSPRKAIGPWIPEWTAQIDREGMPAWARATMPGRMGTSLTAVAFEWWVREMGRASPDSVKTCLAMAAEVDEPEGLEHVAIPTLMVAPAGKAGPDRFGQRQSLEALDRFRRRFPVSELATVDADSYHVAATHPDACADVVRRFVDAAA